MSVAHDVYLDSAASARAFPTDIPSRAYSETTNSRFIADDRSFSESCNAS